MKRLAGLMVLVMGIVFFTSCNLINGGKNDTNTIKGKAFYCNESDNSGITICIEKTDGLRSVSNNRSALSNDRAASDDLITTKTLTDGSYEFTDIEDGVYTIYAISNDSSEKAVQVNVTVDGKAERTVTVDDMVLTPTGSISGKILVDNVSNGNSGILVYVPGTSYCALTADDGSFVISDIPVGSYKLAVEKGYYTFLWTNNTIAVKRGTTVDAGSLTSIKTSDLVLNFSDGENGVDGTDGQDGKDGVSIKWLGSFENALSIKNPSVNNAYFNTTDGCSYIYDGKQWTLLAKGVDTSVLESVSNDATADYNIYAIATERGILFETKILCNTGSSSSIEFNFFEKENEIKMIREWTKSQNAWITCKTYYPFVEEGKEYTFEVSAVQKDFTLYKKDITITAIGGLGEFRIENADDYDIELTSDKVIHNTKAAEYTDNENVFILSEKIKYGLFEADNDAWNWITEIERDTSTTDGTLPLNSGINSIISIPPYEKINARLSGHLYRIYSHHRITVAGYQDNGQTVFEMNGGKEKVSSWGGQVVKVPVLIARPCNNIENLPGEKVYVEELGRYYNVVFVNYGFFYHEPSAVPTVQNVESCVFNGWKVGNYNARFPLELNNFYSFVEETITIKKAGESTGTEYDFYVPTYPDMEITYPAVIMDGNTKYGDYTITIDSGNNTYNYVGPAFNKIGYVFDGVYGDSEFTTPFGTESNTVGYIKWIERSVGVDTEAAGTDGSKYTYITTGENQYVYLEEGTYCIEWVDQHNYSSSSGWNSAFVMPEEWEILNDPTDAYINVNSVDGTLKPVNNVDTDISKSFTISTAGEYKVFITPYGSTTSAIHGAYHIYSTN